MSSQNLNISTTKAERLSEIMDAINSIELSDDNTGIPVQLSVLRNFTVEGIEPLLKYRCLTSGLRPNIVFGNYDMVRQEILDTTSHLYTTAPDIIVTALYLETYLSDGWHSGWNSAEVMNNLAELYSHIARNTDAIIAVNTFIAPFYSNFGITNNAELPSRFYETQLLNHLVRQFVRDSPSRFILVDWERIVLLLGEGESMDYRFWYMSKSPFKKKFLDLYALEIVKIARALKGKTKKCLVLDCDNTLWGGIIGEDGLQGIKLDHHSYPGNTFYEFQNRILNLHERGVLISLCSKNNEQDVWDVLDKHPHCLLKREHLSAWRVNWQDKASNIKALAEELNLGLDSFVFIDDSPTECGLVRDLIPEVTVLQVPDKLYSYPQLLDKDGLFDTLTLSAEDRLRSRMYRDESIRKYEQAKYETLDQYLLSLSLSITVHQVKADEMLRVAQLTQKTNQFNLTTRRYSEAQIAGYINDPAWAVISLSVKDKFGDSGLTGVLIASHDGESVIIDNLLMSCRVLGRNIETAFVLRALDLIERAWRVKIWKAEYIKTQKNQQVAGFWDKFGFTVVSRNDDHTVYELTNRQLLRDTIPYITIEEE